MNNGRQYQNHSEYASQNLCRECAGGHYIIQCPCPCHNRQNPTQPPQRIPEGYKVPVPTDFGQVSCNSGNWLVRDSTTTGTRIEQRNIMNNTTGNSNTFIPSRDPSAAFPVHSSLRPITRQSPVTPPLSPAEYEMSERRNLNASTPPFNSSWRKEHHNHYYPSDFHCDPITCNNPHDTGSSYREVENEEYYRAKPPNQQYNNGYRDGYQRQRLDSPYGYPHTGKYNW